MERRKHKRFKAKAGAFAVVTPDLSIVGPILNISNGGLAFRNNPHAEQIDEFVQIGIYYFRHGYHIEKMPVKIISHFDVYNDEIPQGSGQASQYCAQFSELTYNQTSHLKNFIQLFTDKAGAL